MLTAIRQWVIKTMTKGQTGVVTTMPKQQIVEMNTQITAERILRNGINPEDLKTVGQVENVINQIDQPKVIPADSAEGKGITEQLLGKKKADVLDMEGNKIPDGAQIMGGKQIQPINMTVEERTGGLLKGKYESDEAIKTRLVADNKKGIKSIKISLVDDSIAKIKSMEPMDAMKEANLVAGKKGRYANLDDNQVKKIMDDTEDHIFERDIPDEDFATGGRVGLKGGAFLNFIKNMTMNKKSPLQFGKDYLKNVKEKTLRANETGKFMDLPLAEVGIPAASGALVNNQIRKKLENMNEIQKEENLKMFIMELENDEFYDKYPDIKDEMIADYTEKLFGEKKADGGRIGYFMGSAYPKGTAALREMLKFFGKKSDSVKNPSDILRIVNPKQFNKMLEDPRIYGKFDVEKGIAAPDLIKDMQKKMMSDRQSTVKEMLGSAKNIKKSDDTTLKYKNEMIEEMMNKGASREMAEEMAETISKMAEGAAGKSNTPKLTDEGILQLENILKNMETGGKKPRDLNADGGRIGFFKGAQADTKEGKSMSPGTDASGGFRGGGEDGGNNNPPPVVKTPPPKPKPKVKKNILTGSFTPTFNFLKKFAAHDRFTDQLKAGVGGKNYHQLGGLDFMARFPDINPSIAKGLASAYQTIFEGGRAIADGSGGYTLGDANKRAKEEARLNAVGIDAFADPDSSLYQEYTDMVPESGAVQMADGGRIGYKVGSVDKMRRLILKAFGAGTAGIAAAKSGIFSGLGKGATKQVAKEVAQQTTSSMPPPYFFKLAEKIKMMGDDATATTERTIAKTLKSKDGKSEYLLEEDITSGDTIIKKINKEGDDMITDVEIMQLRKGEDVITKDGKAMKTPDEYEEVTESNSRIYKDEFNDPNYEDGIKVDEIIKEVDDKIPSIKYASGGLAYMLGE